MSSSRLTPLDASFLEVESSTAHMHVGWAGAFAPPRDGRPPCFTEVRDHIDRRMCRAPRYRQKLAKVPLGVNDPVWIDDPDFDIARHVHRARSGNLGEVADSVMSAQLDRDRPLWEIWIADRLDDGRVGVVGKAHHAMVDGIAAVELATLLFDPSPEPSPPEPDRWRPSGAPSDLRLLVDGAFDRLRRSAHLALLPMKLAWRPQRAAKLLSTGVRAARAAAGGRAFNLVVSNIPGPPESLYMLGCELEEVYPVVPLADRHAISIGFTTVKDQAFFGVYADRESVPDADDLARAIAQSVDELRAR